MTYDEALEQLTSLDPQWSGFGSDGLQNHTTMVAHALHVLGFEERIASQLEVTRRRYRPLRPATDQPLTLGDGQMPGWVAHWLQAIERQGWKATLYRATGELAPGVLSGSLHGWIRTAHAARALLETETSARRLELAFGLAVWASWYEELAPAIQGDPWTLTEWLANAPKFAGTVDGLIDERVAAAARRDDVRRWAGHLRLDADPNEAITAISQTAAHALAGAPQRGVSGHLHGLTASSALRPLLELIDWDAFAPHFVHAFGALLVAHPRGDGVADDVDADALRARAGVVDDDHVIKVIEAALREFQATGNAIYLRAAGYADSIRS